MSVSIVIPAYNAQEWIADAIQSALDQTVFCEVIVVNDGSTDHTQDIIDRFPVKAIHQTNRGLPSARNTGIMNAEGDRILFLDADDILQDNCVEELLKHDADVVAPSFKTFGTTNELVLLIPNPKLEDFKAGNRLGYCALIKKSVLQAVGGYSPRMVWGYEDLHLWITLLSRGYTITTVQEPLWLYRTKENSMIHEAIQHHDELMAQIYKDNPQFNG